MSALSFYAGLVTGAFIILALWKLHDAQKT